LAPHRVVAGEYARKYKVYRGGVRVARLAGDEAAIEVALAVDVEGHKGRDGRLYLVDLARLMPPQPPQPSDPDSGVFFLHWRPEFMARYCVGNA
jgi:hypothetical protein